MGLSTEVTAISQMESLLPGEKVDGASLHHPHGASSQGRENEVKKKKKTATKVHVWDCSELINSSKYT